MTRLERSLNLLWAINDARLARAGMTNPSSGTTTRTGNAARRRGTTVLAALERELADWDFSCRSALERQTTIFDRVHAWR